MPSLPLHHRTLSWPSSLHHLHDHLTSAFATERPDKPDKQTPPVAKKPRKASDPLPDIDDDPFAHFISPVVQEDDPISLLSFSAGILPAHDDDDEPVQQQRTKTLRAALFGKWAKYVARHQAHQYRETSRAAEEDDRETGQARRHGSDHGPEYASEHEHNNHAREHPDHDDHDDRPASPPPLQPDTPSPPPSPLRSTTAAVPSSTHTRDPTGAAHSPDYLSPSAASELAMLRLGMQQRAKSAQPTRGRRRRRRSGQDGRTAQGRRRRSWREPGEEIWTVLEEDGEGGGDG